MDDLDALERLEAQATPGPWRSAWEDEPGTPEAEDDDLVIYAPEAPPEDRLVVGIIYYDRNWAACSRPNAALIAAARNALPTLCAELRRLRRVEEKAKAYEAAVVALEGDPDADLNAAYHREHETKAALWSALEP